MWRHASTRITSRNSEWRIIWHDKDRRNIHCCQNHVSGSIGDKKKMCSRRCKKSDFEQRWLGNTCTQRGHCKKNTLRIFPLWLTFEAHPLRVTCWPYRNGNSVRKFSHHYPRTGRKNNTFSQEHPPTCSWHQLAKNTCATPDCVKRFAVFPSLFIFGAC